MKSPKTPEDDGLKLPWDEAGIPSAGAPFSKGEGRQPTLEEYFAFLEMFSVSEEELRRCKIFPRRFSLEP